MIRFEFEDPSRVWEGAEPVGREGVDLFDAALQVLEADGFASMIGAPAERVALMRRLSRRDRRAIVLRTLAGWKVDGVLVTASVLDQIVEDPARRLEAATVATRIWERAGFFGGPGAPRVVG